MDDTPTDGRIERYALEQLAFAPHAIAHAQGLFRECGDLFEASVASAPVRRLSGISQLGLKRGTRGVPETMVPPCAGEPAKTTAIASVTRREHSERTCAAMIAFCSFHAVPYDDLRHAALAALFHDLGHSPFSHATEPVLVRRALPNHEETGRRLVLEHPDFQAIFRRHGIDPSRVAAVMREEGDFGLRQKLVDTATYLVHDARSAGIDLVGPQLVWGLMRSVSAVRAGAFHMADAFLMGELLERRAEMMNLLYEHPYNRLNALLVAEVTDWLIQNDWISARALMDGTDADVLSALDRAIASGTPEWVASAARFVRGKPTELRRWNVTVHSAEASARDHAARADLSRPRFLLPACDCTGKTMPVTLRSGERLLVRAPPESRPAHHRQWHVLSYSGPT